MSVFYVSTSADLSAASVSAKAGDVISLASGTYSALWLDGLNFSSTVTITSTDPNNPAVLTGLNVQGSSNLAFTNLGLAGQADGKIYDFGVLGSSNISFDHVSVSGPALGSGGEKMFGLYIRGSSGISVTNSEFTELQNGIFAYNSNGVIVSGNAFHDLQSDGVQSSNTSHLSVSDNFFTDFHPQSGDHPDAIQIFTSGQAGPTTDISISGNVVARGTGDAAQGIFITDEAGTTFQNVSITDNLLIGTMWNAIMLTGATSGTITNNTVLGYPDMLAFLRMDSSPVTVAGNSATAYVTGAYGNAVPPDNSLATAPLDCGAYVLSNWYAAHALPAFFDGSTAVMSAELGFSLNIPTLSASTSLFSDTTLHAPVVYYGSDGADVLDAQALNADIIYGGAGNDILYGKGSGAVLNGGTGDDTYYIRSAGDLAVEKSGEGLDQVFSSIDYTLGANIERLTLVGTALNGSGNELDNQIFGNDSGDLLHGLAGNDVLQGGAGNDILFGDDGNDTLKGGPGDDQLHGGAGNDIIEGGVGNDKMWGDAGADKFIFRDESVKAHDSDEIFGFERGVDKIDLSAIDANINARGNNAFKLIGAQDFHHSSGELQAKPYGDGIMVSGDVNGDGSPDFQILVHNIAALSKSDFVL
ncbi:right-handed parallel beta-helix repeat-containing protein [Novosphingobium sp. G106]|uniref:calcium-binding protein n=1 Tax=Novosphingobium sp. G106 TaxID=2849500 RepID=UPI001C2DD1CC|nr:right-handed parallel beta-helix repeat-containing protein [Novosphingobium sp. G106]MBV1692302.1 right-handed parallel beta-helix repeat-containing protein [Novosphingobium sp. G106]